MGSMVVHHRDPLADDRQLVPLVHETGTPVIVGDITTQKQLDWWREVGADTVQGTYVGLTERSHKVGPARMLAS